MVRVEFERHSIVVHGIGPVPWVQLQAGYLQIGPDSRQVACYRGGVWDVEGNDNVTKFGISGARCMVRFANNSESSAAHGPYRTVEVVNGAVYTQPDQRLLALFDEGNQLWFTYADGRCWPLLVIEDGEGRVAPPDSAWESVLEPHTSSPR
jgi:hypothetical protein